MEQDNKKKKKIIGISLGVVGALLLLFSGTYAYWQLTKEQSSANEIVAACLDFELSDVTEAISLERAYPISEEESESLTGYTFKVKNNCNDNIDYTIGLNSITNNSENYLDNSSLRVKLDDKQSKIYETLNDIEYIENVRYSKELGTSTILGNSENTHLLKVWVDENAPVTEQGKSFTGKIIITGSVGNTSSGEQIADSCFLMADDGTLLEYNYACGTDVVVPAEVDGIQVKTISSTAFKDGNLYLVEGGQAISIADKEHESEIEELLLMMFAGTQNVEGLNLSDYTTVYESIKDMKADHGEEEIARVDINIETLNNNELNWNPRHKVTSLDLSSATYLESIDDDTFNISRGEPGGDGCGIRTDGICSFGPLENLIFPTSGNFKSIGYAAFENNNLTRVVIPSIVTYVGSSAFRENPLTEVIIKRPSSAGISINYNAFYSSVTNTELMPIYNPNYTE